jgi:hypothetical protein
MAQRRATRSLRDRADARSSELVVRNHDHDRAYEVTVGLADPGAAAHTAETYRLDPGEVRCATTVAPRGRTRVTARLRCGPSDAVTGPLGDTPDETVLVEVGNGIVAATHGL